MKTLKRLQVAIWIILVFGWLIGVLYVYVTRPPFAFISAMIGFAHWIATGFFFAWLFGIRRHVRRHLQIHLDETVELSVETSGRERFDVARALRSISQEQHASKKLAVDRLYGGSLLTVLKDNVQVGTLRYETFEIAPETWDELAKNAIYLIKVEDQPCIVSLFTSTYHGDFENVDARNADPDLSQTLQVVARDYERCQIARRVILERARAESALKEKCLIVRRGKSASQIEIAFTTIEAVERERIVLPVAVFEAVERTVVQQMQYADRLRHCGQRTQTAVLMFGPPGTGKTLLTKHLITQSKGMTTILVQGFQQNLVRETFRLARYLEPTLVVLEDVDLIAVRRQRNRRGTGGLHALLDELDGLSPATNCVVLMTTNRPDVLEPALAKRPGRVTQAVEFPLPDVEHRQKLLSLFLDKVTFSDVDLHDWAVRTDGSSPAFLEELARRSVLIAIRRSDSDHVSVCDDDLRTAIHEIVSFGGPLTKNLLGARVDGDSA